MSKITIIVPVYKAEQTLCRCVDSVLNQTFTDFELILIDDGSPDRSGEICDAYAKKDPRVRVIHQKNAGAAAARNKGISESVGTYLAFADSDDALLPTYLEQLLATLEHAGADIAVCNFLPVKDGIEEEPVCLGFAENTLLAGDEIKKILYRKIAQGETNGLFCLWNKLIRAELVKQNRLALDSKMSFGEDLCFIMDLIDVASGISFTEAPLYRYTTSSSGLFGSYRPSVLDNALTCYQKLCSALLPFTNEVSLSRLHCRYFYYVNRHLSQTFEAGRRDLIELRRTIRHPGVKNLFARISDMSEAELRDNNLSPYEQKLPRLVASGKAAKAERFARYLYDRRCFLRRMKTLKAVLFPIQKERGCCKCKSLRYSVRAGGLFVVYPKSKLLIDKNASFSVDGEFYFNKPWHGKQNRPATLVVSKNATFSINGYFVMREGVYISVEPDATLLLSSGTLNNGGKISCFSKISLGNDVRLSEDVILRDSDNHEIVRKDFTKSAPIVIGDHVWVGLRAVILKGTVIGSNSIIAAGALVNKSIPNNTLAGGIPAKIIKEDITWR